jgi:hypothetical protein
MSETVAPSSGFKSQQHKAKREGIAKYQLNEDVIDQGHRFDGVCSGHHVAGGDFETDSTVERSRPTMA